jgi:translation initiation factor 3 subunit C
MSNFWNDEASSEEEKVDNQKQNPFFMQKEKGKYAYESESSEEEKRVMKTPKDKMLEVIKSSYNKIKDFIENKNYIGIGDVFDDMIKQSDRVKNLFDKYPDLFLRILYLTEESINISKEDKTKLSAKNNTAFNNLKKNFTKQIKNFEDALKIYKENKPSEEQLFEDEKADELSDADNKSVSSASSIVDINNDKNEDPAIRRLKWVKKKPEEVQKDEGKKEKKIPKDRKIKDKKDKEYEEDVQQSVKQLTENEIEQECSEISNQRGHLGKKPSEIIARIDYLLSIAQNTALKIKLLNLDILLCFDTSPGQLSAISIEMWQKIHDSIIELMNLYHIIEKTEADTEQYVIYLNLENFDNHAPR